MDRAADQTLTDLDGHATITVAADGTVTIDVSPTGFRLPPAQLARLIVDTASNLPNPATAGRDALESGTDAVTEAHRALATGGFDAFSSLMRDRLGLETPATPPIRSSDQDANLAAALGATLDNMRRSAETPPEPEAHREATAATDEGDAAVTTSTERIVAAVQISAAARSRGAEGLGRTLTDLLHRARTELRDQSSDLLKEELPEPINETMDQAATEGERTGQLGAKMMDDVVRRTEALRRKAGK